MGSLISTGHRERVHGYVERGTGAGAEIVTGGAVPDGAGAFYPPTVVAASNELEIAQEEVFGPVVTVTPFEDEKDAIRLANDVRYGSMATVWTGDPARGHRLAARIKSGTIGINMPYTAFPGIPFGGYKQSGFGRELASSRSISTWRRRAWSSPPARVRSTRSASDPSVESVLDAIGNTPLVRLGAVACPANGAELWLKLEYHNPTGSMKDRMARAMIEGAERDGLLAPGDTVVEYTGGSTGPALALVCRVKGYRALIVMADCFTEERFQLVGALGGEIDVVPSVEGRPKVTVQDYPQHGRPRRGAREAARPLRHRPVPEPVHRARPSRPARPRDLEQTVGRVTAFCHGMGTASSLMGVSDALRPHGVFIQAHEPASSAAISGGEPGPFLIQGWRPGS